MPNALWPGGAEVLLKEANYATDLRIQLHKKMGQMICTTQTTGRIALHLGYSNPVEFALDNLLASPGAIVVDRGQIRRMRTLAPARRQDGAVFFWTRKTDAGSTACLRTAAAISTGAKPTKRRISAAARAITRSTWHGKRSSLRATLAVTECARPRRSVAGRGARQDAGGDRGSR
jgi:hypothetical protein